MNPYTPSAFLSLCIPTHNRVGYLYETLSSIVSQQVFNQTTAVNVHICDNLSDDGTDSMAGSFAARYPGKVFYHSSGSNHWPTFLERALSYGDGEFLKAHNDTLMIRDGCLNHMIRIVVDNFEKPAPVRPLLFFGNRMDRSGVTTCRDIDEFVSHVTYYTTWMGAFGMWRSDFESFPDFSRAGDLYMVNVDVMLRSIAAGRTVEVLNDFCCLSMIPKGKHGYNIAKVFGENYLSLYKPYLESGMMSSGVYKEEKKRILIDHIIPQYFDFDHQYNFDKDGFFKYLHDYWGDDYFWKAADEVLLKLMNGGTRDIGGIDG
jgi:glycosyltransferase involved in cell wall biosynthesis